MCVTKMESKGGVKELKRTEARRPFKSPEIGRGGGEERERKNRKSEGAWFGVFSEGECMDLGHISSVYHDSPQGVTRSDGIRERTVVVFSYEFIDLSSLDSNAPWVHVPWNKQAFCECFSFGMSTLGSSSGRHRRDMARGEMPLLLPGLGWGVGVRNRWSLPRAQDSEHTNAAAPLVPSSCLTPTSAVADHRLPHLHCREWPGLPTKPPCYPHAVKGFCPSPRCLDSH